MNNNIYKIVAGVSIAISGVLAISNFKLRKKNKEFDETLDIGADIIRDFEIVTENISKKTGEDIEVDPKSTLAEFWRYKNK